MWLTVGFVVAGLAIVVPAILVVRKKWRLAVRNMDANNRRIEVARDAAIVDRAAELGKMAASADADMEETGQAIEAAGRRIAAARSAGFCGMDEVDDAFESASAAHMRASLLRSGKNFAQMAQELDRARLSAVHAAELAEGKVSGRDLSEIDTDPGRSQASR